MPNCQSFDTSVETGTRLWTDCYGDNNHNDEQAQRSIAIRLASADLPSSSLRNVNGYEGVRIVDPIIANHMLWSAKWVDGGCRTITADSKYFSAMAQTRVGDAADCVQIPWPAFAVQLPPNLIVDADGQAYSFACFAEFQNLVTLDSNLENPRTTGTTAFYAIMSDQGPAIHAFWPGTSLIDLICFPDPQNLLSFVSYCAEDMEETGSDARIRELVKRATVGLLYTLQNTTNWRHGSTFNRAGRGSRLRAGPPPHRTLIVGSPIKIDVTNAVRQDAMAGSRSAPSVQTLVRGHLKRQVIGSQGTGRKVIWIEPYWRGPEEAPILMRPLRVG